MSILNSASSRSVYRGYEYCKNGKVISQIQLSDDEYEGKVQGSSSQQYYVFINTRHPKKSYCECPFANGNTICKHMVALFFSISNEDFNDYQDWYENDYEENDDYYEEYDEYGNYVQIKNDFEKPIFFDEILLNFVNSLSEEKSKKILLDELRKDEKYTLNKYLQNEVKKYKSDKNDVQAIIEKLNTQFYELSHDYDYNRKDYDIKFLSKKEKDKITIAYIENEQLKSKIDKIILNPEIATYNNYDWFILLYKKYNNDKEKKQYTIKLEAFLNTLKHYSIKNSIPKSNVLISIYLLNDFNIIETAKQLVKNCKYMEYVEYIIENYEDCEKLYKEFDKIVNSEKYLNKECISNIYYKFYLKILDDKIYNKSIYYGYLYSKDIGYLRILKSTDEFEYYINYIINNEKDIIVLERIYLFLNDKKSLFNLLFNKKNECRLMDNIEFLKDEYYDKLSDYLKKRFYEVVEIERNRGNYIRAVRYIAAMKKLDNGEKMIDELIEELKESKYSKRTALFDEIYNVRNR